MQARRPLSVRGNYKISKLWRAMRNKKESVLTFLDNEISRMWRDCKCCARYVSCLKSIGPSAYTACTALINPSTLRRTSPGFASDRGSNTASAYTGVFASMDSSSSIVLNDELRERRSNDASLSVGGTVSVHAAASNNLSLLAPPFALLTVEELYCFHCKRAALAHCIPQLGALISFQFSALDRSRQFG